MSASRSRSCAAWRSPEAMPTLAVTVTWPLPGPSSNGRRSAVRMRSAMSSGWPSASTTNSSPPRRPMASPARSTPVMRVATVRSSSSHRVAERVVDALEAVEIDEHGRRARALAAGAGEHLLGALHDQRAVGEPGERVVERLVAELAGLLLDHAQGARPPAGQHLHEQEGEQADDEPADEDQARLHGRR